MNNGALRCEVQFLEVLGRSLAILATGAVFACAASGDTVALYKLTKRKYESTVQFGLESPTKKVGVVTRRRRASHWGTSVKNINA